MSSTGLGLLPEYLPTSCPVTSPESASASMKHAAFTHFWLDHMISYAFFTGCDCIFLRVAHTRDCRGQAAAALPRQSPPSESTSTGTATATWLVPCCPKTTCPLQPTTQEAIRPGGECGARAGLCLPEPKLESSAPTTASETRGLRLPGRAGHRANPQAVRMAPGADNTWQQASRFRRTPWAVNWFCFLCFTPLRQSTT